MRGAVFLILGMLLCALLNLRNAAADFEHRGDGFLGAALRDFAELAVVRGIGGHDRAGQDFLNRHVQRIAPEGELVEIDRLFTCFDP